MANSYPGAQSVVRAIRLLKLFGKEQEQLSLQEAVEQSQLNKTTTFRLLSALESEGLIERTERNEYRLGPEMIVLGRRAMQQNGLMEIAKPLLVALTEQVNEQVTLEQPVTNSDGSLSMLLLYQTESFHRIGINQLSGTRFPLHVTSTGKAYLAFLDQDNLFDILPDVLERFTARTITESSVLQSELQTIRTQGYASVVGELEEGLVAVGSPILDHTKQPIAAISIEAPESRVDEESLHHMAGKLMEAAKQISGQLGYQAV